MKKRVKLNTNMTQAEFNKFLDAKLEEINPLWAAANRTPAEFYGEYIEIQNSKAKTTCPLCKRLLLIYEFSTRNMHITGICWDCRYESAINKIKFNPEKYKHSPLRNMVREETRHLTKNGYVKLGMCFCGKPATKWHHPNYNRPHEVVGYCKYHHEELHKIITNLEAKLGFIPFHHKKRYYTLIKQGNELNYILKPEYEDEIGKGAKPLTYREIKGLKRKQHFIQLDEQREEDNIIAIVIRLYGKKYTKKNVADYKARESERKKNCAEEAAQRVTGKANERESR